MTFMPQHYDRDSSRAVISKADLLEHLAEMAAEMKNLARSIDAAALAGMFDRADREAREQLAVARARLEA